MQYSTTTKSAYDISRARILKMEHHWQPRSIPNLEVANLLPQSQSNHLTRLKASSHHCKKKTLTKRSQRYIAYSCSQGLWFCWPQASDLKRQKHVQNLAKQTQQTACGAWLAVWLEDLHFDHTPPKEGALERTSSSKPPSKLHAKQTAKSDQLSSAVVSRFRRLSLQRCRYRCENIWNCNPRNCLLPLFQKVNKRVANTQPDLARHLAQA